MSSSNEENINNPTSVGKLRFPILLVEICQCAQYALESCSELFLHEMTMQVPPTNASLFAPTTSKEFDLTGLDPETPAELKRLKSKSAGKQVVKDIDIIVIDDVDDDAYDEKAQHRMRPDDVQNERDNPEQPKNFCNMEDFLALF